MERFVLVSTTNERNHLVKATTALESAGIPVIVQHSFQNYSKSDDQGSANYRVMVPDRFSASASQVLTPIILNSKKLVKKSSL